MKVIFLSICDHLFANNRTKLATKPEAKKKQVNYFYIFQHGQYFQRLLAMLDTSKNLPANEKAELMNVSI